MLGGKVSGVTLLMLSSLDCARSGEASARTAQMLNEKKLNRVGRTQLRQRISFIDSGELELSEPRVCADARKKVKNILLFLQKKTVIKSNLKSWEISQRASSGGPKTRVAAIIGGRTKEKRQSQSSAVQNPSPKVPRSNSFRSKTTIRFRPIPDGGSAGCARARGRRARWLAF